jgi:hypothetical protein
VGSGSYPLSCAVCLQLPLLQAFLLLITGRCCCSCQPPCLFTGHVGSGSSLLSYGVFLPPPLSQAFLLLVAGCAPPLPPEPLLPTWLVYLQFREGFPSPSLWRSGLHTLFPLCLYCSYCLLVSFSFFPEWGQSVQPRLVCGSTAVLRRSLFRVFPTFWARATGGPGALLVSPLNVKWRFSARAGGVEGSEFCLFSVIMPAKCVSSISLRFHYRRIAFCFPPLAAILESS